MDMKAALKAHMKKKGAKAHPDSNVKKLAKGGKTNAQMKAMGRNGKSCQPEKTHVNG
jgi:hypothetical protein